MPHYDANFGIGPPAISVTSFFGMLSDAIHALKIPKAAVAYQREHGAPWVRDEALVSADGALRRCGAVSGRLFSASSAQPNQVGTSGDISGTGRAPLGFDSGMFRRSEATSLPSDSTWPCSLDRATVWPCACSRRRVSEIRQGGSSDRPSRASHSGIARPTCPKRLDHRASVTNAT